MCEMPYTWIASTRCSVLSIQSISLDSKKDGAAQNNVYQSFSCFKSQIMDSCSPPPDSDVMGKLTGESPHWTRGSYWVPRQQ